MAVQAAPLVPVGAVAMGAVRAGAMSASRSAAADFGKQVVKQADEQIQRGAKDYTNEEEERARLAAEMSYLGANGRGRMISIKEAKEIVDKQFRRIDWYARDGMPRQNIASAWAELMPAMVGARRMPGEITDLSAATSNAAWAFKMDPGQAAKEVASLVEGRFPEGDAPLAAKLGLKKETWASVSASRGSPYAYVKELLEGLNYARSVRADTTRGGLTRIDESIGQLRRNAAGWVTSKLQGPVRWLGDVLGGTADWVEGEYPGRVSEGRVGEPRTTSAGSPAVAAIKASSPDKMQGVTAAAPRARRMQRVGVVTRPLRLVADASSEISDVPGNQAVRDVDIQRAYEQAVKVQEALKENLAQTTKQIHEQADALQTQATAEGKSKSELRALTIAQLEKQRADLEATESVIPGYIQELEKRIDAEKRMLRLEQAGEEATATKKRKDELKAEADKRTKEEGDKADKVAGDIQGGFRKAFVDAVNGADNVLENLGKSLQKTLSNAVADALYDALLEEPIKKFSKELARAIRGLVGDKSGAAASGDGKGLSLEGVAAKIPGGGVEGGASGGAGGGFISGIGDALSRMGGELWKTVASIGGTLKGALSGLLESFTKPSSGEGGSWFSAILGLLPFAKGGAFPAGTGLSAYASQIVDRPTLFPFAKGIGLMGEAGAEGILPLRRDAQGRLGVSASGVGMGGGGIVFSPTSVFHVDARSDRGAVIADMQRLLGNNNRAQMEHLQRLRVVPT